ncbi:hypothetical protein NDU88_004049 [Pleurodeles waltl]|uniref:Uncharacterized protein n=1 Tax=Pleurodeles waltl TaxID=8319 RepID=A0AAV7PBS5_PLEWA|nr:hypothetical protein NDU88_004049 [Pleurodeles waltl]
MRHIHSVEVFLLTPTPFITADGGVGEHQRATVASGAGPRSPLGASLLQIFVHVVPAGRRTGAGTLGRGGYRQWIPMGEESGVLDPMGQ